MARQPRGSRNVPWINYDVALDSQLVNLPTGQMNIRVIVSIGITH